MTTIYVNLQTLKNIGEIMNITCPIAWFEIVVQDLERAIQFYESIFNTQLTYINENPKMKMAIFPYKEGYPSGALVQSDCYADHHSGPSTVLIYLATDSVAKQLSVIKKHGGEEVFAVTPIGKNGYIAGFKDTEGNYIGLWSQNL